jgi:hypothetical protein
MKIILARRDRILLVGNFELVTYLSVLGVEGNIFIVKEVIWYSLSTKE